jgi:hypothetical protein
LRQNLRDLKVADATVQLENLAREVGIDLSTWIERPLAECEGQIVAAFRDLKAVYEKLRTDLMNGLGRLHSLEDSLREAPADFHYPTATPPIEKLLGRPALIEGALESARADEVERLRSEFDGPARLGNFQPLMSRARDLLEEPRNALTQLLGHVLTVENAVSEYRRRLAESQDLVRSQRGLEALAAALGTAAPKTFGIKDIEAAGALSDGIKVVKARVHENSVVGGRQLGTIGVSFERWCAVVAALDSERDPALEAQESDALVDRGLVQRTYRLGRRA